jgi:mono/diheme cytochrome c family protein
MRTVVVLLSLLCTSGSASAENLSGVDNPARARVNYMLNCQGCHGPEGAGSIDGAVPTMQDYVGNFLKIGGGREYLVRVPGSANAALDDEALAELLNWMLPTLSPGQMPENFKPYLPEEIGRLRAKPLHDVSGARAVLVAQIEQDSS